MAHCERCGRFLAYEHTTPRPIEHGKKAYGSSRCRCEICREAWRMYMRQWREQRRREKKEWGLV